jgi:hypothetical protein
MMQFVYALAVQIDDVLEQHTGMKAWFVMPKKRIAFISRRANTKRRRRW